MKIESLDRSIKAEERLEQNCLLGKEEAFLHESIFHFPSEARMRYASNPLLSKNIEPASHTGPAKKMNHLVTECSRGGHSGGSVVMGGECTWGGSEGTTYSIYGNLEAHDDKGNHAEASVTQNSDGTGSATISAGHESNSK